MRCLKFVGFPNRVLNVETGGAENNAAATASAAAANLLRLRSLSRTSLRSSAVSRCRARCLRAAPFDKGLGFHSSMCALRCSFLLLNGQVVVRTEFQIGTCDTFRQPPHLSVKWGAWGKVTRSFVENNKIVVAAHDARGRAHSCSMGRVPEELALRPRARLTRLVPLRSKLITYIIVTMAHAQLPVIALAQQRLFAAASQRSRMRRVVRLQQTACCRPRSVLLAAHRAAAWALRALAASL